MAALILVRDAIEGNSQCVVWLFAIFKITNHLIDCRSFEVQILVISNLRMHASTFILFFFLTRHGRTRGKNCSSRKIQWILPWIKIVRTGTWSLHEVRILLLDFDNRCCNFNDNWKTSFASPCWYLNSKSQNISKKKKKKTENKQFQSRQQK